MFVGVWFPSGVWLSQMVSGCLKRCLVVFSDVSLSQSGCLFGMVSHGRYHSRWLGLAYANPMDGGEEGKLLLHALRLQHVVHLEEHTDY